MKVVLWKVLTVLILCFKIAVAFILEKHI